jgi:predicted transcriptional regulator
MSNYAQERASATLPADLPICRYDPRKEGLERFLGPQEAAIMEIVWGEPLPLTVKTTWKRARSNYSATIAYTTIMTTMTRLFSKGFFHRGKNGLCYVYSARETREEFEERQIAAIMESLEET